MYTTENYIYKQIYKGKYFCRILYSFIETYFHTNENRYAGTHMYNMYIPPPPPPPHLRSLCLHNPL